MGIGSRDPELYLFVLLHVFSPGTSCPQKAPTIQSEASGLVSGLEGFVVVFEFLFPPARVQSEGRLRALGSKASGRAV